MKDDCANERSPGVLGNPSAVVRSYSGTVLVHRLYNDTYASRGTERSRFGRIGRAVFLCRGDLMC